MKDLKSFWGNCFLAKRTAIGLVRIGIVAPVTVGGMDAAVEPIGILLLKEIDGVSLGKQ
ncbi:hypothetical protein L2744_02645 [Shewanella profunda]|uniref:hypothetical protein n=1 Tax=Shewanella profunda TaxID=254793 RepID=UPI00200F96A0|nr:hypothetical protein [Shewanella profunda]MCL1088528.1 hypothetical protein [Shewanella profunda]